jgi:hypothetical protein
VHARPGEHAIITLGVTNVLARQRVLDASHRFRERLRELSIADQAYGVLT